MVAVTDHNHGIYPLHVRVNGSVSFTFIFVVANVANHALPLTPLTEPRAPVLKGYLKKYTNFFEGYNPRWFVLKEGVLSCASESKAQKQYLLRYFT